MTNESLDITLAGSILDPRPWAQLGSTNDEKGDSKSGKKVDGSMDRMFVHVVLY
jgi:hypothetical protein